MPLNRACVGRDYPPITTVVTTDAIGAYARAYNDDNPAFFDASRPGGIVAPPMFGVVVTWNSLLTAVMDPELSADLLRLVHGDQDMRFLVPIRPGDTITARARISAIEAKTTGEALSVALTAENQSGETVQRITFGAFIRSGRRPSTASEKREADPVRAAPIVSVAQQIDLDQSARYAEASGDRNPIHLDENVARMAGLGGIIIHGLCTMAFTSKVMIDRLCGGDPVRLKRLAVRFSRPVRPGDTITTKVWSDGERDGLRIFAFETYNPKGYPVIQAGAAEVSA